MTAVAADWLQDQATDGEAVRRDVPGTGAFVHGADWVDAGRRVTVAAGRDHPVARKDWEVLANGQSPPAAGSSPRWVALAVVAAVHQLVELGPTAVPEDRRRQQPSGNVGDAHLEAPALPAAFVRQWPGCFVVVADVP